MPINTAKPLLAEAEALLASSGLRSMDELIDVCCVGLNHLALEADSFCNAIPACAELESHFVKELTALTNALKNGESLQHEAFSLFGEVHHRAFGLVEDMALFFREKKLRDGYKRQHPDAEQVMEYFESSGNWAANSGDKVTDMYFNGIPIRVKHDGFIAD